MEIDMFSFLLFTLVLKLIINIVFVFAKRWNLQNSVPKLHVGPDYGMMTGAEMALFTFYSLNFLLPGQSYLFL